MATCALNALDLQSGQSGVAAVLPHLVYKSHGCSWLLLVCCTSQVCCQKHGQVESIKLDLNRSLVASENIKATVASQQVRRETRRSYRSQHNKPKQMQQSINHGIFAQNVLK